MANIGGKWIQLVAGSIQRGQVKFQIYLDSSDLGVPWLVTSSRVHGKLEKGAFTLDPSNPLRRNEQTHFLVDLLT